MGIREQLLADITAAMKAKEMARLDTLRMVKTELQRQEIEIQKPLDDAGMIALLTKLLKQRQESAESFAKGGRAELAAKEQAEIVILDAYLPKALTDDEIAAAVDEAVRETGATTAKDMGNVMKAVMAKLAGQRVDGKTVNALVRAKLS